MESEKVKKTLSKEQIIEILKKRIENINPWETHALEYHKGLLDLINELESNYQNVCVLLTAKNEQIVDLTKENERLKNCIATLENKVYAKEGYYNAVKDRALEVFVQKIEAEIPDESTFGYLGYNGVMEIIDETLKEFIGK